MKAAKIVVIGFVVYVGIVITFESLLGVIQPTAGATLLISTVDGDGSHDRVVTRLESAGKLYVAANHWPRAWYERALQNADVRVAIDGEQRDYLAVSVSGAEHDRVDSDNSLPLAFRVLTGFPPRYFLRLDAR